MSKAVLISIKPKWCEMIASGEKTIEVRKTAPKIETPFKCYIYETRGFERVGNDNLNCVIGGNGRGKVIGEFVCDKMFKFSTRVYLGDEQEISDDEIVSKSCVPRQELRAYEGRHFGIYGWHISDLVIYDTPKKLSAFQRACNHKEDCGTCKRRSKMDYACIAGITVPPQSWCYVEVSDD